MMNAINEDEQSTQISEGLLSIYIYKTEASAGTTIFHVNTIFKK